MDAATRELVRQRARGFCEYCGLAQADEPFFTFHIEHIVARQHGGGDEPGNLALACHHCNLRKGPNLTGLDPESGAIAPLFHPRRDLWAEHFAWVGVELHGLTPAGRATIAVLRINAPPRLELRALLRG